MNKIRVITFQSRGVLDTLLEEGEVTTFEYKCVRYTDDVVDEIDNEYVIPFYSFVKTGNYNEYRCISLISMYNYWGSLMGFYRFNGRCILEFDIPIKECKYKLEKEPFDDLDNIIDFKGVVECITYKFKKEWLVASYECDCKFPGYNKTLVTPTIYKTELNPLFTEPVYMSGDGYAEKDVRSKLPHRIRNEFYLGDITELLHSNECKKLYIEIIKTLGFNIDINSMKDKELSEFFDSLKHIWINLEELEINQDKIL